ncbi:MAG: right-handed parallel beta-helix repeat-containing protein, partial [bacterium]
MKTTILALVLMLLLTGALYALPKMPVVAVHLEKSSMRNCESSRPLPALQDVNTTYQGVGEVDALIILYNFTETRGFSLALSWPEAWGMGRWTDCGDLNIGEISNSGDPAALIWNGCVSDSTPLLIGWLTLTVSSPGMIDVLPTPNDGVVAILNCDEVTPAISEAMIVLRGGAGGLKGDDPAIAAAATNRNWYIRPDGTGDMPSIHYTLRHAMPGDTVFAAGGHYQEHIVLRAGVTVLGSYDDDFAVRDLEATPSVIDGAGHQIAVEGNFGEDTTTVFDGFVITGGSGKYGAGVVLRNGSSPLLKNLIIHSNSATFGAGIFCLSSSPVIRNVLIAGCEASRGGAIYCMVGSSPLIVNSTLVDNRADLGAALAILDGSSLIIDRSILANNSGRSTIFAQGEGAKLIMTCCDLWGSTGDDYGGTAEKGSELRDNVFVDP